MKKRKLAGTLLLALGPAALVFALGILNSRGLKNELKESRERMDRMETTLAAYKKLSEIDSLLVKGDFSHAMEAYEAEPEDAELADGISFKRDLARQLMALQASAAPGPRDSAALDSAAAAAQARALTAGQLRQLDSLNFELEKARVQTSRLRSRLSNATVGEYLTFKSAKGNNMHFVGQVRGGKANGYGVAILDTGSRYEGEWLENERHGEGAFYWPDGESYVGEYANDQRSGEGTYYWPNGEKYTGHWKDDKRSGEGVFYGKDGEVVTRGVWKDDKLVEEVKDRDRKKR